MPGQVCLTKPKGIWMGGTMPLGDELGDRELRVNTTEAEWVRKL